MADSHAIPSTLRFPEWQTSYEAALLETDHGKLTKFIGAAETAILSRLQVLVGKAGNGEERLAMTDALHALRYLKGSLSP